MTQLILHLLGDYVTQSDWMAQNKTKRFAPAAAHAVVYSLPFLFLGPSWVAFSAILVTHFFIDRYRLARFVVFAKNYVLNSAFWYPICKCRDEDFEEWIIKTEWKNCSGTGYPADTPPWLAVWLLIAADNTLHLGINYLALRYL